MSLSAQNEVYEMRQTVPRYKLFSGRYNEQMPCLVSGKDEGGNVVDAPRSPGSFRLVLDRRLSAPEEVRPNWSTYLFTGDGALMGTEGDAIIDLDSPALREVTSQSFLIDSALKTSLDYWYARKQSQDCVYLTADEVAEAHGKGYVQQNGLWVPQNRAVAKAWEGLSRGLDLREYTDLVHETNPHTPTFMQVYFRTSKRDVTIESPWVVYEVNAQSYVGGLGLDLGGDDFCGGGRLVGVGAPQEMKASGRVETPATLDDLVTVQLPRGVVQALQGLKL